jgi:hypothetical protein
VRGCADRPGSSRLAAQPSFTGFQQLGTSGLSPTFVDVERKFGKEKSVMPECFKYGTPASVTLETALQIALHYFERAGEIDDYAETRRFLADTIELMMKQGQYNKLILANRAISAYEKDRNARTIELILVS